MGRSSPRSGEFPRVTRCTVLAFPSRLHLDIICERSCPQDDHAGRRCAQDDAARPGAELPTQRLPAGRYVRASAHPDPGAWDWLPHPNPSLQGLGSCVTRSLFPWYFPTQEAKVGRGVLEESGRSPISRSGCKRSTMLTPRSWSLPGLLRPAPLCRAVLELLPGERWTSFAGPEASSLFVHLKLLRKISGCVHL